MLQVVLQGQVLIHWDVLELLGLPNPDDVIIEYKEWTRDTPREEVDNYTRSLRKAYYYEGYKKFTYKGYVVKSKEGEEKKIIIKYIIMKG